MKDLTGDYDYERMVSEEKSEFDRTPPPDLLANKLEDCAAWDYYWQRTARTIAGRKNSNVVSLLEQFRDSSGEAIRILGLGSGYCGAELRLAERFSTDFVMTCTDLNPLMFENAKSIAREKGWKFEFQEQDLNFIDIEPSSWDLIYAHASIHHVINMEHLFEQIAAGLKPGGYLHLIEVIGADRRLLWPENEAFLNGLIRLLPPSLSEGVTLRIDSSESGMEGIRQEQILPLLDKGFDAVCEYLHGAFFRFACMNRLLGERLDPGSEEGRRYIDFLIDVDQSAVSRGLLRPLELWGIYQVKARQSDRDRESRPR